MSETPRYTGSPGPDCPNCKFLGRYHALDLYLCQNSNGHRESVVARESSVPSDYASSPAYLIAISALSNEGVPSNNSNYGLLEAWK